MDREKVIKAWEIFRDSNPYEICSGREFRAIREPEYCMGQMIEDTIALLKEQEAVEPKFVMNEWRCGACGHVVLTYNFDINEGKMGKVMANYCPSCGRSVKWE